MSAERLLDVYDLEVIFGAHRRGGGVRAVDGVSLSIDEGETLGLVGESGCGKSTIGRAIVGLQSSTGGAVAYRGRNLGQSSRAETRAMRRELQIVFQDPYSTLNPRKKIGRILAEPFAIHGLLPGRGERTDRVKELLAIVGLDADAVDRYPHEFSGGQRQRIGIARALALEPKLIICDEPVSSLDVSIQAQIVNLLQELQDRLGLAYLFIAHDLAVVRHISHRTAVMYLGRIVELAPTSLLFEQPLHPYTKALMSAVPEPDPEPEARRERIILDGDLPSPSAVPAGCRFHGRCPWATEICRKEDPLLVDVGSGHQVACHRWEELRHIAANTLISTEG
jgi:oligopeptide/dipeptide ABC transporter ATP-binding protein